MLVLQGKKKKPLKEKNGKSGEESLCVAWEEH